MPKIVYVDKVKCVTICSYVGLVRELWIALMYGLLAVALIKLLFRIACRRVVLFLVTFLRNIVHCSQADRPDQQVLLKLSHREVYVRAERL